MSATTLAIWSMVPPSGARPGAPLLAVDRAQFAVRVRPFVPDADAVLLQPAHVGVAAQEPQQLVDDGLQVQLLGGDQRKASARSKRIWWPKTDSVPVPVRSCFSTPVFSTWSIRSRYWRIRYRGSADSTRIYSAAPAYPTRALRSASLMRLCQPSPVARKRSTTSRSSLSVTCCFVGAFCGPRWPRPRTSFANSGKWSSGLHGANIVRQMLPHFAFFIRRGFLLLHICEPRDRLPFGS